MAKRGLEPSMVALFDSLLPDDALVERRKMFGYPAAFIAGKLFAGLFRNVVVLRLPQRDCDELAAEHDVSTFEPIPGRKMRGLLVLPETLVLDRPQMAELMDRAMCHASSIAARSAPKPRRVRR